jgi:hypothetical protein
MEDLAWALTPLAASALQRLDLHLDNEVLGSPLDSARNAIAGLKSLKHLGLRNINDDVGGLLDEASNFAFQLESLELSYREDRLDPKVWSFARVFGSTLKFLSIQLKHPGVDDALSHQAAGQEGAPSTHFSALRHLRVAGAIPDITTILKLCSISSISTLEREILAYRNAAQPDPLSSVSRPTLGNPPSDT